MKLSQLRYVLAVAENNLNVSLTAKKLFTSQSGISKQIILLEDELGIDIFIRNGKFFTGISPAGEIILIMIKDILSKIENVKQTAFDLKMISNENITDKIL